jgi:hypothetical protein
MNTALLGGAVPWLTIRVEQRERYFAALRGAQLKHEYREFAQFIISSLRARGLRE